MKKKISSLILLGSLTLGSIFSMSACGDETTDISSWEVIWSGLEPVTLEIGDPVPDVLEGVSAVSSTGEELEVHVNEENSTMITSTDVARRYTIEYYATYNGEVVDPENGYDTKTFIVERGSHIDNTTFDTGIVGWSGNPNAGSAMTYSWDENEGNDGGSIRVDVTNPGSEYWQNQVETNGLDLKANTTYVITFDAKSTNGRNIGVTMENSANNYAVIEAPNSLGVPTTTEWATYTFYYTTDENSYSGVKFGFLLGRFTEKDDEAATVWIDNISVKKADKLANSTGVTFENTEQVNIESIDEIKDAPKVTAKDKDGNDITDKLVRTGELPTSFRDDMTIASFGEQYMYTDEEGNISYVRRQFMYNKPVEVTNEWDLVNGDFDEGLQFWIQDNAYGLMDYTDNGDGTVTIATKEGKTSNPTDWHAQLYQSGQQTNVLRAGQSYEIEMRAKINCENVDNFGTIRFEFDGDQHKTDIKFTANDEWIVVKSNVYTPTEDRVGSRLGILLGQFNQSYSITIDYVHINKVS